MVVKDRMENLIFRMVGKDKERGSCNSGRFDLVTSILIRR